MLKTKRESGVQFIEKSREESSVTSNKFLKIKKRNQVSQKIGKPRKDAALWKYLERLNVSSLRGIFFVIDDVKRDFWIITFFSSSMNALVVSAWPVKFCFFSFDKMANTPIE